MSRPSREFRAESFEVEGRLLLSPVPASIPVKTLPTVTVSPIDRSPDVTTSGPLDPSTLASYATLPPMVVSAKGTPHGIVLTFSKPMDPVAASNVQNYAVRWTTVHGKHDSLGPFSLLMRWGDVSTSSGSVRLRSARYDPATQSVSLIPRGKLAYSASTGITVTQGHPAMTSGRPGHPSNLGQGLTDLEGNPINGNTTPGKFRILVGARVQLNSDTTPATTTVDEKPVRGSE